MTDSTPHRSGRHYLQIPGPTNTPDAVLRAMAQPTVDHRGPEFAQMTRGILQRLGRVFQTSQPVILFPSSGTGAWEAALVNTLSPDDKVLAFETGHFATLWRNVALRLGLEVEWVESDWRHGVDPAAVETRLRADTGRRIKAVLVVHNETSTGITSNVAEVRRAIDAAEHPALLIVDAISSLGSIDYGHEKWGVDVTICASQKGLMLPPGLGINAVSGKAMQASQSATFPKSYWDWGAVIKMNERGFFPYTPPTHLLYGMDAALDMLLKEGLANVFARHHRLAEATRRAAAGWGLEFNGTHPSEYSDTLTAIWLPEACNADDVRKLILSRFDMSLGTGLGRAKGKLFRIGHLGDFNELMLAGTLCGVEMGLSLAGVPHIPGGVNKAMDYLTQN
jgi:alanine-glyoxylate transaminase/serine-glyoxylate transaminase/serine-pyruvate transaminase